ncbi:MAG: hypothetical protein KatS3mg111_4241 [Pirellulaceae bacterium]|nr:MAG: hypothetical protein KatS3mg111_4241 [Pirellulaceae bacterium]
MTAGLPWHATLSVATYFLFFKCERPTGTADLVCPSAARFLTAGSLNFLSQARATKVRPGERVIVCCLLYNRSQHEKRQIDTGDLGQTI